VNGASLNFFFVIVDNLLAQRKKGNLSAESVVYYGGCDREEGGG